jgi:diguanylate cyclase (GGDEF)-like protein/PAS domain S-box-containing protein
MTEAGDFYKDLIDNLYDGVYFVDRERTVTYWNKGAERITGYKSSQVVGRGCRENILNHVTVDGGQLCQEHCPLAACMEDGNTREADVFLHHADGHRVPVLVRAAPLRDSQGNIIGAVETFSGDMGITSVRRELQELRSTVQLDKLTGIGNRRFLEGRLHAAVAELEHRPDMGAALLFMDVDHFKQFNDTYGHDVGDQILRMVASTLNHNMRKMDLVGRWGGEEFLAILYDLDRPEHLKSVSEKLRILVASSRLDLPDKSLTVTLSIGATLFLPNDTPDALVRRADELMYLSKQAGRDRVTTG